MSIVDDSIELFIEQFKGATAIEGLARSLTAGLDEAETTLDDLLLKRWLELAQGVQLDRLGVILGQPRYGRDDESYRAALYFQIFINTSKADPEAIITATRVLSAGNFLRYWENYPAGYQIFTDGPNTLDISGAVLLTFPLQLDDGGVLETDDGGEYETRTALDVPQELVLFLKFLSPTAIDYISVIFSLEETPLFGVFEFISAYLVLDDGGLLELDDTSQLDVFVTETALSDDGFQGFAELELVLLELDDEGLFELDNGDNLGLLNNDTEASGGGKLAEVMVDENVL